MGEDRVIHAGTELVLFPQLGKTGEGKGTRSGAHWSKQPGININPAYRDCYQNQDSTHTHTPSELPPLWAPEIEACRHPLLALVDDFMTKQVHMRTLQMVTRRMDQGGLGATES